MKDDKKKDWRYYENKMNECFEAGDKELALLFKKKFITGYRKEQPKTISDDVRITPEEAKKIRQGVFITDYNDYKDRFLELMPAIKRQFREKEIPFPEDPWMLFDEVIFRRFEGDNSPLDFDDFLKAGMKIWNERNDKADAVVLESVKQRIEVFAREKNRINRERCKYMLTSFERCRKAFRESTPAVIIDMIKEESGYKEIKSKAPSDKMLKTWITDYRNRYPGSF